MLTFPSSQGGCVPERKIRGVEIPGLPGTHDAVEVSVSESTDRWTDVTLNDGTVLRIKPIVLSALRIENLYDAEGNPAYQLKINQIMTVSSTPDHLKKPAPGSSKTH